MDIYIVKENDTASKIASEFSLHADYCELVSLVNRLKPVSVFLVHAAGGTGTLTEEKWDGDIKSIIYTENQQSYVF